MKENYDIFAIVNHASRKLDLVTPTEREDLFNAIRKEGKNYLSILNFNGDVSLSPDVFQRTFNHFYQVRRNQAWRTKFYDLFQELRTGEKSARNFEHIFNKLVEITGQWEYSFSTKMLHTLDTDKPIIDRKVISFLNIPFQGRRSVERYVEHYTQYEKIVQALLQTDQMQHILIAFDTSLPELASIPLIKKLDFILWKFEV